MAGWVYIISNKAMPNILKIGYTERTPQIRAYELYHTGCPYPYKVDYAVYVSHPYEVEQKTHELQRTTNVGKEWFSCSFEEAVETINKAINLIGAIAETNRKPPELTPDDIATIIQNNPIAEGVLKANILSIKIDGKLLIFRTTSQKIKFEEELFNINSEFTKKIHSLQEDHQEILNKKTDIDSLGFYITSYLFCSFLGYLILITSAIDFIALILGVYGSRKDQLYMYSFFICASVSIVLAICRREIKKHELNKYKNTPFNLLFKGRIEGYEKEREYRILNLKNRFKNSYDIINLD